MTDWSIGLFLDWIGLELVFEKGDDSERAWVVAGNGVCVVVLSEEGWEGEGCLNRGESMRAACDGSER